MKRLLSLVLALVLASAIQANAVEISGIVTTQSGTSPLAGVSVTLIEPVALKTDAIFTDASGRFRIELQVEQEMEHSSRHVTLRLEKDGFHSMNVLLHCTLTAVITCPEQTIDMTPDASCPGLNEEEYEILGRMRRFEGNTLFLLPYIVLPEETALQIDIEKLRDSLYLVIRTHFDKLEGKGEVSDFSRLEPVGLRDITCELATSDMEKVKAYGRCVHALAMVYGIGEKKASDNAVTLHSYFLIMPPDPEHDPLMQPVHETDVPVAELNSMELARRLSPLVECNTLIAIATREFARAKAAGRKDDLRRVRAYVSAQLRLLSDDRTVMVKQLERLRDDIDEVINQ